MRLAFLLVCLFLAGVTSPAPVRAQQEQEKENFDRLMPAMGALERGDYAQAIDSLRPLAADGTIEAQYALGTVLETAPPPLRDLQAAYGWYRLAADQGHAVAQTNLGLMYGMGLGVPLDMGAMAQLLQKAAEAGEVRAQAQLGRLYLDGEGVTRSASEAVRWFRNAAAQGHQGAQFFFAVLLQKGIGVPRDMEAAMAWFRRAAEHGHRLAMLELAQVFELGHCFAADPAAAKQWRDRAKAAPEAATRKSSDASRADQRVDPRRPRP